nr:hypothetical protein [Atopobium sp. oral taxon 416]
MTTATGASPSQDVTLLPEQNLEKSHIFAQKVKAHLKPTPERHKSTLRAGASVHEDARGCTLSIIAPYCSSADFAARMSARSVACEPGLTRAQARSHAQKSTPQSLFLPVCGRPLHPDDPVAASRASTR